MNFTREQYISTMKREFPEFRLSNSSTVDFVKFEGPNGAYMSFSFKENIFYCDNIHSGYAQQYARIFGFAWKK